MTRVLFERAKSGFRTVRGETVRKIQRFLSDSSFCPGTIDGIFGDKTEKALRDFQAKKGLGFAPGKVDDQTWQALFHSPIPSIFERSLQLTADFEGHGFCKVSGNFDDALLTWGIIGFTLKHGEIQKIIQEVNDKHPGLLKTAFGDLCGVLLSKLEATRDKQVEWANSISMGQKRNRVLPEWETAFGKLGEFVEVQKIQMDRVAHYWERAMKDAAKFQVKSEMGLALCFDIAVQNGGIDEKTEEVRIRQILQESPAVSEQKIRVAIATVVAENSNPKWIEDVRKRKLTLALGQGTVHGAQYSLDSWGVADIPAV
jgi:hypothetical protein